MSKPSQSLHSNLQLRTFCLCPRSSGCFVVFVKFVQCLWSWFLTIVCLNRNFWLPWRMAALVLRRKSAAALCHQRASTNITTDQRASLQANTVSDVDFLVNCLGNGIKNMTLLASSLLLLHFSEVALSLILSYPFWSSSSGMWTPVVFSWWYEWSYMGLGWSSNPSQSIDPCFFLATATRGLMLELVNFKILITGCLKLSTVGAFRPRGCLRSLHTPLMLTLGKHGWIWQPRLQSRVKPRR